MFNSIVIFPAIVFFGVLHFKKLDENEGINLLLFPLISLVGVTFAIMMLIAVRLQTSLPDYYHRVESGRTKLVPLYTPTATKGSLFLLSLKIKGAPYYLLRKETSKGKKILISIPADEAILYEGDQVERHYIANLSKEKLNNTGWLFNFFVPTFIPVSEKVIYAIHIPRGGIKDKN